MTGNPILQLGEGLTCYDLKLLPSTPADLLTLVPSESGGVYAFYYRAAPTNLQSGDPDSLAHELAARLSAAKHSPRSARLSPGHLITLKSSVQLPEAKKEALAIRLNDSTFRSQLDRILEFDFLFSPPLYIGKADRFRQRLTQHLDGTSGLKDELRKHNIKLADTKMLLVQISSESAQSQPQPGGLDPESPLMQDNQLIEDILSRMALPGFTRRIG